MLLMHHVAAAHSAVFVNKDGTVATLANRADNTLWHTLGIVRITELIVLLLLLVVAHHSLVRNGTPDILMLIHVDDTWDSLDTHAGEVLLHITFEALRLGMVDTIAR